MLESVNAAIGAIPLARLRSTAVAVAVTVAGGGFSAGCGSGTSSGEATVVRTLTLADFAARPGADQRPQEPALYGHLPVLSPEEEIVESTVEVDVEVDEGPAGPPARSPAGSAMGGDPPPDPAATSRGGETRRTPPSRTTSAPEAVPESSQRWIVDGLLGQINGRPVFANEFLLPLEATLLNLAANPDRAAARAAMNRLIRERFNAFVNSELIISEAESQLSPEQKQGLLAWLRSIQEGEIAARGGTRAGAQASLEEELGVDIEEFLRDRRDRALAGTILQRRVEPRTIVSNREVEREYRRREAEFNPPPTVRIGRIRLTARDAERLAEAQRLFAEGRSFSDVVTSLGLADGGEWRKFEIPPEMPLAEAIERNTELATAIRQALSGLDIDQPSKPTEQGGATIWYAILGVDTPPGRSLYDADVQLQLRAELRGRRNAIEESRYISRLRTRWISEDISIIEERLIAVAFARYWRQ